MFNVPMREVNTAYSVAQKQIFIMQGMDIKDIRVY